MVVVRLSVTVVLKLWMHRWREHSRAIGEGRPVDLRMEGKPGW